MKRVSNYQDYNFRGEGNLTDRQIRTLRKLCGVAGKRLVEEVKGNPKHKWRKFILDIYDSYSNHSLSRDRRFQELLCDVPAHTFDAWIYEQGIKQKRTFRMGKFESLMTHIAYQMHRNEWVDLPVVWRVSTSLTPWGGNYHREVRVDDMHSYVIAANKEEASSVWATMVSGPLGLIDMDQANYHRSTEVRFIGPSMYHDAAALNAASHQNLTAQLAKRQKYIEECFEQLNEVSSKATSAFALATSTIMMTNGQ